MYTGSVRVFIFIGFYMSGEFNVTTAYICQPTNKLDKCLWLTNHSVYLVSP